MFAFAILMTLLGHTCALPNTIDKRTDTCMKNIKCSVLPTLHLMLDHADSQSQFEGFGTGVEINEDNAQCDPSSLHIDNLVSLEEPKLLPMILFNEQGAAAIGANNRIRADTSTLIIDSMDPQSIYVGCFMNPATGRIFNIVPGLTLPIISDLINFFLDFLRTQSGTLAFPAKCDVTATIKAFANTEEKTAQERYEELDPRHLTKTFSFVPRKNLMGQAALEKFNLEDPLWTQVAALELGVVPKEASLSSSGLGSVVGVVDDIAVKGHLKDCE